MTDKFRPGNTKNISAEFIKAKVDRGAHLIFGRQSVNETVESDLGQERKSADAQRSKDLRSGRS